ALGQRVTFARHRALVPHRTTAHRLDVHAARACALRDRPPSAPFVLAADRARRRRLLPLRHGLLRVSSPPRCKKAAGRRRQNSLPTSFLLAFFSAFFSSRATRCARRASSSPVPCWTIASARAASFAWCS